VLTNPSHDPWNPLLDQWLNPSGSANPFGGGASPGNLPQSPSFANGPGYGNLSVDGAIASNGQNSDAGSIIQTMMPASAAPTGGTNPPAQLPLITIGGPGFDAFKFHMFQPGGAFE
jgi:hypothetical protein